LILRIVNRGLDPAAYERLRARTDIDRSHPLGLIMHGASEQDGVIHVAQVWDEPHYAERYDRETVGPALAELGLPLEADIQVFVLRHLVTP
jgi:hypothetical protein